jgi:hypothetical protein
MDQALQFECDEHASTFECPDSLISYSTTSQQYGLIIHDGGTSSIGLQFCPWCGSPLDRPALKNIQVIDGALNCVYDIFASSEEDFELIFSDGIDIAFAEDFDGCSEEVEAAFSRIWEARVPKSEVRGIHGITFYGFEHKRQYYPSLRDEEAMNPDGSRLRAGGRWEPPA